MNENGIICNFVISCSFRQYLSYYIYVYIYIYNICNIYVAMIHSFVMVSGEQGVKTKGHLEGNLCNADHFIFYFSNFNSFSSVFFSLGVHADV